MAWKARATTPEVGDRKWPIKGERKPWRGSRPAQIGRLRAGQGYSFVSGNVTVCAWTSCFLAEWLFRFNWRFFSLKLYWRDFWVFTVPLQDWVMQKVLIWKKSFPLHWSLCDNWKSTHCYSPNFAGTPVWLSIHPVQFQPSVLLDRKSGQFFFPKRPSFSVILEASSFVSSASGSSSFWISFSHS